MVSYDEKFSDWDIFVWWFFVFSYLSEIQALYVPKLMKIKKSFYLQSLCRFKAA